MLTQEDAVEIKVLARQGKSIRQIARELRVSRNTVRRYLREEEAPRYGPRAARPTKLEAFKGYLRGRVEAAQPEWIPAPDPISAIEHCMESRGLCRKDLEPFIGSRARVSEVMTRRRPLTLGMIRRLAAGLGIPTEVLIQPYPTTDHRAASRSRIKAVICRVTKPDHFSGRLA